MDMCRLTIKSKKKLCEKLCNANTNWKKTSRVILRTGKINFEEEKEALLEEKREIS